MCSTVCLKDAVQLLWWSGLVAAGVHKQGALTPTYPPTQPPTSYLPINFALLCPQVCLPLPDQLLGVWLLEHLQQQQQQQQQHAPTNRPMYFAVDEAQDA
jgi:hypothetical protein